MPQLDCARGVGVSVIFLPMTTALKPLSAGFRPFRKASAPAVPTYHDKNPLQFKASVISNSKVLFLIDSEISEPGPEIKSLPLHPK